MALDREQVDLLSDLVEASRTLPSENRQEFRRVLATAAIGRLFIGHPGLDPRYVAHEQDVDVLEAAGLIRQHGVLFYVTPHGFRVYAEMKRAGAPAERVESEMRKYLNSERFRQQYPAAHEKLVLAESLLWAADSTEQLSAVGHHCREGLQVFVTALVEQHAPVHVSPLPEKTVARLQAVIGASQQLGDTEREFCAALVAYWGTVNDLVQRQEHGGQKEGRPITSEDARRVVFQSMCVMYEVGRALGHPPKR